MMKPEEHKKHGEAKVIRNVERAWCFGGLTAGDDYFEGFEKAAFTLNGGESEGGPFSSSITVTELPLEGWALEDA